MDFELDHVFVLVAEGGPEADRLLALGFAEGPPNVHAGQGTACRRFLFANAFLELVWVTDPDEARGEVARPLRLWERWSRRHAGACPFGVCFRPARPGLAGSPFPAWDYRPPSLPEPLCIRVGDNSACVEEPLLFYLPFLRNTAQQRQADVPRQITRVLVCGPRPPSPGAAGPPEVVTFRAADEHLLEVGLDGESAGGRCDLRPVLPLVLRW